MAEVPRVAVPESSVNKVFHSDVPFASWCESKLAANGADGVLSAPEGAEYYTVGGERLRGISP